VSEKLLQLVGAFALLSLLAVGGGVAVLPEMKRVTVEEHPWVSADQFVDIYSLGQLAPGPNMMMVTVIGYRVAGPAGALAVTVAFFLPASLLTFGASRLWSRFAGSPWRLAVQRGLAPVAIGLMASGVVSLAEVATRQVQTITIALVVLFVLLTRRINPAWLILAGGVAGWLALPG
jgi:chromate transporter